MREMGIGVPAAAPGRLREIWNTGDAETTRLLGLAAELLGATVDCVWPQGPWALVDARVDSTIGRRLSATHPNLCEYLAEPIADHAGRTHGFLCAVSEAPRTWTERDRMTLAHFASALATRVELQIAQSALEGGHLDQATHRDLERRNGLLAAIVQQSDDAIVAKNTEGIITEWNRGAEALYGYSAAEAVGAPVSIIIPPERAGEDQILLANALSVDHDSQFETTRVRRDGSRVDVSLSISPLVEPDGTVAGVSIITRDITARVEEERARRQAEEQLRVTVDYAPIGMGLVDLRDGSRGRLISLNGAMSALLETNPGRTGSGLLDRLHHDDREALDAALATLAEGTSARRELELRLRRPSEDATWALFAFAPVPAESGTPTQAVVHAMDIGDRKRFEGQLLHLADHDALTGLFNRRRFEAELDRSVAHSQRYGFGGALLLIDLDGFKFVNDTMGHSHGDELVARIGTLLQKSVRETDVVARIGGDEFAVIVGHADAEMGSRVARKILTRLRESAFMLADRQQARVTGSIGVTTFDQGTRLSAEELLIEADIAMYQAKNAGKDQLMLYRRSGSARSEILERESWLTRIRSAIDDDGFELLAQPIVAIRADAVPHFELLLRMRCEDGSLLRPNSFLYDAERFDLIQQIDRWVFAHALTVLEANHRAGHDVAVSVNMSGKTLGDPAILADLGEMLQRHPVKRERLIVEVTETAAITNIDGARIVARGLRELGCRFALDDFGAGFASFYYLKHLEFDYLKIDGEFVRSLLRNPTDELVIKSVVDIARGLHVRTIAEAIPDDESLQRLAELGVDFGQGYHLGRPMTLSQAFPQTA